MINRQARSITGMYSSTPIHPLLCEAGLIPASILLDYRQRVYAHRLLSFPDLHPAKEILPINLREGDKGFRPEELPENTLMWTQNVRTRLYGQWLAWQITIDHSIVPAEGVEPVTKLTFHSSLKPDIIVKGKREAIEEAKKDKAGLVLCTDGSKLDQGHAAAAVCWEDKPAGEWKEKSIFLGKNKEILDAELCAILEALDIVKKIANAKNTPVIILCDSQKALGAIALPFTSQKDRFLIGLVYQKTEELQHSGHSITFQ